MEAAVTRKRVLLADNKTDFLETLAELLDSAGYDVFKASTLSGAQQILKERWVHLAILDLRLVNDEDDKDRSGLALAEETTSAIPKIILTAFPTHQDVRTALKPSIHGPPAAVDFVDKHEGIEELIAAVDSIFADRVRINWNLIFQPNDRNPITFPHLVSLIEPGLEGQPVLDRAEEMEDMFRRLFYDMNQIRIDRMLWLREGRVALAVFAFKANAAAESFVVVCGQNAGLVEEAHRFHEFSPKVSGEMGTTLRLRAETTHFAANSYTLSDADLEDVHPLLELYRRDAKLFRIALVNLFQESLLGWGKRVFAETTSRDILYRKRLGLTEESLSEQSFNERVQAIIQLIPTLDPKIKIELADNSLKIRFDGQTISYPDPTTVLFQSAEPDQSILVTATPGALSGDNILTDGIGRTWLTDFADAGTAPILWNLVTLDAAIRFDWVEVKSLQRLHEMETRLVQGEFARPDIRDLEAPLRRAVGAIQVIQGLVAKQVGKDIGQYHSGILFQAAQRLVHFDPVKPLTPTELARLAHALIAAGMLTMRLHQNQPLTAQAVRTGLSVDLKNQKLQVDGRQIHLTPTEFKLLGYLYEHADQLCARKDVFEYVWSEKFDLNNSSHNSRLDTNMDRLREKVEPEPTMQRYLFVERGVGYRLYSKPKSNRER